MARTAPEQDRFGLFFISMPPAAARKLVPKITNHKKKKFFRARG
jgi:hypothetical protein